MIDHCQICQWRRKRLVIDHSHITGLVRGAICRNCNARLVDIERDANRHKHFRYLYRPLDSIRNSWYELRADLFKGSRVPILEVLESLELLENKEIFPEFKTELEQLLANGQTHYTYPPEILSLDDIEIAAVPCALFHQYLESPPLAYLNLTYRSGMTIELNN